MCLVDIHYIVDQCLTFRLIPAEWFAGTAVCELYHISNCSYVVAASLCGCCKCL